MFYHLLFFLIPCIFSDTLFFSLHHYPNLYAFDTETQKLITDSVLDIKSTDYDYDNLHWRGMKLDNSNSIFYAANSKKAPDSFIGKWICGNSFPLDFNDFYTQYNSKNNDGLDHPYELVLINQNTTYVSTQNTQSVLLYDDNGVPYNIDNSAFDGAVITYADDGSGNGVRGKIFLTACTSATSIKCLQELATFSSFVFF